MTTMLHQVRIKFFLTDESVLEQDHFIPIFHRWIRDRKIPDYLLIDVADYRHVPDGPGIMLIANEAQYGMDCTGGRPGLLFSRRRDPLASAKDVFRDAVARAAFAANAIENEESLGGKLRFRTDNVEMSILDRLVAPNNSDTRSRVEPVWSSLLEELGYQDLEFSEPDDPRSLFGLRLASKTAPALASLC